MRHHIVLWKMAKRELDVDEAELAELRELEARGEVYIEFLDGERVPHSWDPEGHRWVPTIPERTAAAA